MPDGEIIVKAELDDKKAQAQLSKLEKKIHDTEASLNEKQGQKNELADKFDAATQAAITTEEDDFVFS